jgi:hypothetical protein
MDTLCDWTPVDIAGLYVSDLMVKKGVIDDVTQKQFWVTFLASAFRSIRFGIQEAHGRGQVRECRSCV